MKFSPRDIILVALFAALTAIGAFIKVPVGPIPISLQSFFTISAGLFLGARLGALSQLVYIGMGLVGLPVFTSGGGPSYVLNPAFGFLVGFALCSYVVGKIAESGKPSLMRYIVASFTGTAVMYAIGVPWLYMILVNVSGVAVTFTKVMNVGCLVFLPGDILKVFIISGLASRIVPRIRLLLATGS